MYLAAYLALVFMSGGLGCWLDLSKRMVSPALFWMLGLATGFFGHLLLTQT